MTCYNTPQGFASVPNNMYNNPTYNNNPTQMFNQNQESYMLPSNTNDAIYMQQDQWVNEVPVNPMPSSPLPVPQTGGGTSFFAGEPANMPPETLTQHIYIPGFLSGYIGQLIRVEFLVGIQTTNRVGYLREVGASYILLESVENGNLMMCDLCAIKFVTIPGQTPEPQVASLYEEA